MQISGSWTAVLPTGQITGSWSAEVPTDRLADTIAARVAAQFEPSQRPDTGRHGEDFPPADVNQHRHAVRFSPDPDQLYGEVDQ